LLAQRLGGGELVGRDFFQFGAAALELLDRRFGRATGAVRSRP
jgi:hypothetical protein